MRNKYKYLFKNIGLLTISRFGPNVLSFFLVPLYTSILSTAEYGKYDLVNTTVSLLIPVLTINISVAVFRFSIDGKNQWKDVFSVGLRYLGIGTSIVIALLIINRFFGFVEIFSDYGLYMVLMFVSSAFYETISNFSRGLEKIIEFAIAGIISTVTLIVFNILFLVIVKIGLEGYFLAHILANLIPSLYLAFVIRFRKYICLHPDRSTENEMKQYSIPMIANAVGWWINNASDRYVVTMISGIAANGVYSVAYKIPTILSIFQNIFNQAWVLSAVKDFDKNDDSGFFTTIYNTYNFACVAVCSLLIMFCQVIARILFAKDFYDAWEYVPFLLMSVVFGAMSGYFGCIFSAVKKPKIFGQSTMIGAVINLILNFILVYIIGPLGAAIATAFSYFVVWAIRYYHAQKYINMNINLKRDCITYGCLLLQSIAMLLVMNKLILYIVQVVLFGTILFLSRPEIKYLMEKGRGIFAGLRSR